MNPSRQLPLEGIRVLDFTRVMSGPFCTAMLADLGADVIKIEMPGFGEEGRHFAPHVKGESTYFALLNRGKRSVTINLKTAAGAGLLRRLAQRSDVLVENYRPGVMARAGLDYEPLRKENPRLVYASISGFGQSGPFAGRPAFDLVIQAMSGLMSVTGERGGRATAVGESIADVATGMFAAWGITAALFDRERTGSGRHLDVAMLDSVFAMLLTSLARRLFTDQQPARVGNRHPETYPVDSFTTRDGDVVVVGYSDSVFGDIANAIGQPQLADDPRFKTNRARSMHEDELRALIAVWAGKLSQAEVLDRFRQAEVPAAPVWSLNELLDSGHLQARGMIQRGTNSVLGEICLVPQPVQFSESGRRSAMRTPTLGEDTDDILRSELGLSDTEIAALRADKAI
ncbi:MAG: CoA transferase [Bradyrhizobium sp.]|uniref:CaiB/BaiF CoA transferase family protein n=1 Tax=Bradyrhizobium sp. TaxID=376 RepID=UPI001E006B64|nr:CoA transferase [Bradyrhizobium sp.]MBV9562091.1 CoA transferase [Bradyrhizobium sp.]